MTIPPRFFKMGKSDNHGRLTMNMGALHKLGYGVYVVTSKKGDRLNGQIANIVFQVTAEPPTVAVRHQQE